MNGRRRDLAVKRWKRVNGRRKRVNGGRTTMKPRDGMNNKHLLGKQGASITRCIILGIERTCFMTAPITSSDDVFV